MAEGDEEFQKVKDTFAFIVARGFYCHTALRFGPCKHIYNDEYVDYQIALRYFQNYPQLVFNDDCIKAQITQEFWTFMGAERGHGVHSLSTLIIGFIFVYILI